MLYILASYDDYKSKRTLRTGVFNDLKSAETKRHNCLQSRKPILLEIDEESALKLCSDLLTKARLHFKLQRWQKEANGKE